MAPLRRPLPPRSLKPPLEVLLAPPLVALQVKLAALPGLEVAPTAAEAVVAITEVTMAATMEATMEATMAAITAVHPVE